MYKCAKCNDFLDGHKCNTCMLMHRCLLESCKCQQYPNLPLALGHDTNQVYSFNPNLATKTTLRKQRYRTKNIYTSSLRKPYSRNSIEYSANRLDYRIMARIESESKQ